MSRGVFTADHAAKISAALIGRTFSADHRKNLRDAALRRPPRKLVSERVRLFGRSCPEPNTGCWLFEGSLVRDGYGRLSDSSGNLELAHRMAWRLSFGPVPPGMQVLHKCDTPPCINPAHLFIGSHADNMRDMSAKDRSHALRPKCRK